MTVEIPKGYEDYVKLFPDGSAIELYKCPVPGCKFTHAYSAGTIGSHMQMTTDEPHKKFYKEHGAEVDGLRKAFSAIRRATL